MSSIVGAITGGANQGINFRGQGADMLQTVDQRQLGSAYENTQQALKQQSDFLSAIQGQNGLGNQSNVFNQLQGVANGTGPNPAQAMLANATGANIANQSALMASQRGSGSNVGMMARQAANQGSNIQQNSAGQAAGLQAQQSLGALGQMGGIANQQVGNQLGLTNAYANTALGQQSNLLNAATGMNNSNVAMQSNINNANAAIQGQVAGGQLNMFGNVMSGVAGAMQLPSGGAGGGGGGMATAAMAQGGQIEGPQSFIGKHFKMAKGGMVPALVSPGEQYLDRKDVNEIKHGKNPLEVGEKIPGTPKVQGNSYENDTVPKKLEEGGIVIPNSVMQSKNPKKDAAAFVAAVLKKQALKGK